LAAFIGGCGSAYGYAYVGFGELIAWIVGWDLLLEYTISVSAVSVGWSAYANDILRAFHLGLPTSLLQGPLRGGIINILAPFSIVVLAGLLMIGVKSSARFNNVMVSIKLAVLLLFIAVASQEVQVHYWSPFMPYGWAGVTEGAALIFFAYVGFDAVSTAAEEALNPARDLPIGILASLAICTVLYIVVSALLTGIVPYQSLNVASPMSHALLSLGYRFVAALVGVAALAGLTTVMLVLYYGVTRVFLAMSRDGLLPILFAKTHPVTGAPVRIIILCGLVMVLLAATMPINDLAELVNIGTLFAFIIVCSGVLYLRKTQPEAVRPFRTPYLPYVPILGIISCCYLIAHLPWVTILRFALWMGSGLLLYFVHSRHTSVLAHK
jgi:APA family basic amino acid/polyamine antiporter